MSKVMSGMDDIMSDSSEIIRNLMNCFYYSIIFLNDSSGFSNGYAGFSNDSSGFSNGSAGFSND
jgi:hypothetical protein